MESQLGHSHLFLICAFGLEIAMVVTVLEQTHIIVCIGKALTTQAYRYKMDAHLN